MRLRYDKVCFLFLIVLLLFVGWASALEGGESSQAVYSAEVSVIVDIAVMINTVDFGVIAPGESSTITDSITFTNNGNVAEDVEAKFLSSLSPTEHGLIDGANTLVITGDNFNLGGVALTTDGTMVVIASSAVLIPGSTVNVDAGLSVPAYQEPASYFGTVELII